jgi:hypothetical protein
MKQQMLLNSAEYIRAQPTTQAKVKHARFRAQMGY